MSESEQRFRLDMLMAEAGLARSRSRASDLIRSGSVTVDGEPVTKAGTLVPLDAKIVITDTSAKYVSRGAIKLIAALDNFRFDPRGRIALDIGASTGGFTQVLLERGAEHVTAVDVGHGQMDVPLALDHRVNDLSGFDARDLTFDNVPGPVTAIVADVSFISLTKALPAALALAASGCWLVALIKPQFEVGREAVGKRGVVKDEVARLNAAEAVRSWLGGHTGWQIEGVILSPIRGKNGNYEYLIGASYIL